MTAGFVGLVLLTAIAFAILSQFAGGWGIPYFPFTTANGSKCTNTWTGYTCPALTRADFELYAETTLPIGTRIRSASYTVTNDVTVDAALVTNKSSVDAARKQLVEGFGGCGSGPVPDQLANATHVCRMSTDDDTATDKPPPPRLFSVVTGIMADGSMVTVLHIQSR